MSKQFVNLTSLFVDRALELVLSRDFDSTLCQNDDLCQAVSSHVLSQVPHIYNTTEAQQTNPIDIDFLHHISGRAVVIEELIYQSIQYCLTGEVSDHALSE